MSEGMKLSPKSIRIMAWNCLAETGAPLLDKGFEMILAQLRNEQPPLDRISVIRELTAS
jgi:hypothetical protein